MKLSLGPYPANQRCDEVELDSTSVVFRGRIKVKSSKAQNRHWETTSPKRHPARHLRKQVETVLPLAALRSRPDPHSSSRITILALPFTPSLHIHYTGPHILSPPSLSFRISLFIASALPNRQDIGSFSVLQTIDVDKDYHLRSEGPQ